MSQQRHKPKNTLLNWTKRIHSFIALNLIPSSYGGCNAMIRNKAITNVRSLFQPLKKHDDVLALQTIRSTLHS